MELEFVGTIGASLEEISEECFPNFCFDKVRGKRIRWGPLRNLEAKETKGQFLKLFKDTNRPRFYNLYHHLIQADNYVDNGTVKVTLLWMTKRHPSSSCIVTFPLSQHFHRWHFKHFICWLPCMDTTVSNRENKDKPWTNIALKLNRQLNNLKPIFARHKCKRHLRRERPVPKCLLTFLAR